jgi:hypothetical protein
MKTSLTLAERKKALLEKIESHKTALKKLEGQLVTDIGQLAIKCGLDAFDLTTLETHFKNIAKDLKQ